MISEADPLLLGLSRDWWSVLNTIGTVVAAIATAAAVVISLYLATRGSKFRGKLFVNISLIFDDNLVTDYRLIQIRLVNKGDRNVKVTGIGWRVKPWPDRSLLHQLISPVYMLTQAPLPSMLLPGEDATWYVDTHDGQWFVSTTRDWIKRPKQVFVFVAFSDGTVFESKVAKGILQLFQEGYDKSHQRISDQ
jgi:hypothetical protein